MIRCTVIHGYLVCLASVAGTLNADGQIASDRNNRSSDIDRA